MGADLQSRNCRRRGRVADRAVSALASCVTRRMMRRPSAAVMAVSGAPDGSRRTQRAAGWLFGYRRSRNTGQTVESAARRSLTNHDFSCEIPPDRGNPACFPGLPQSRRQQIAADHGAVCRKTSRSRARLALRPFRRWCLRRLRLTFLGKFFRQPLDQPLFGGPCRTNERPPRVRERPAVAVADQAAFLERAQPPPRRRLSAAVPPARRESPPIGFTLLASERRVGQPLERLSRRALAGEDAEHVFGNERNKELGEVDEDQVLLRVDAKPRTERAGPTVGAVG